MSIAITDDHRALAETASDVLTKRAARAAARELLEAADELVPQAADVWKAVVELGWTGLHLPEEHGGAGYGLEELVVVIEELGRAIVPGPFVPTVVVSAFLAAAADEATRARLLPGLADGSVTGAVALDGQVTRSGDSGDSGFSVSGSSDAVLGGGLASVFLFRIGDDVALVEAGNGVTVETPANLDPTRRSAKVRLDSAAATVLPGAAQVLLDLARILLSAEAVGVARECTDLAAAYAKVRIQFGRPIAMYQAVKHHCANMCVATELATAAVWDAARAASGDPQQRAYAAAVAAALAGPAADLCANLSTQVHGGIAITWEHDLHMYLRRATALLAYLQPRQAAADLTALTRDGVVRDKDVDLPPEAEALREEVRRFAASVKDLPEAEQRDKLVDSGYAMPHWPKPWGRDAGAVEQLVVEQEFGAAGVARPNYNITGWVILTLIQHATEEQVQRWVPSAMRQEVVWCQLFSEPEAGSDAAGIKSRATKVEGGWILNGQKVWTSGAHVAGRGFATVRTNPDAPKHAGITTVVIDMHAPGVEVRPLKMTTGQSHFNEVFFTDVFIPDEDVVGPIDGGWAVARATLGNESVSIGGGQGGMAFPATMLVSAYDAAPDRLTGGASRVGTYVARLQAMGLLNLRSANRAVAGSEPGPEGAITKLVLSELGHEAAAMLAEMYGPETLYMDGDAAISNGLVLMHRGMSIAGGTSEIKRNQIGERILGLPRDPLIK